MPSIPIAEATLVAIDRIVDVLREQLPTELAAHVDLDAYRLFAPEQYITARRKVAESFKVLNIDEVGCWVVRETAGTITDVESGDGTQEGAFQDTPIRVSIIARTPDAMPDIDVYGRGILEEEWVMRRAEKFKGALMNVVTRHVPKDDSVHWLVLDAEDAESTQFDDMPSVSVATILITTHQNVLIRR